MSPTQTLATVVTMLVCSLAAHPGAAQTAVPPPAGPASSFLELAKVLKPGTVIRITDANGHKASGTLGELSTTSLELRETKTDISNLSGTVTARSRRFSEADVRSIEIGRGSGGHGVLLGLSVGAGAGALTAAAICGGYRCQTGEAVALLAGVGGGIGALVGLLTDSGKTPPTTVYTSGKRQANVHVSPVLSRAGGGAVVTVRF